MLPLTNIVNGMPQPLMRPVIRHFTLPKHKLVLTACRFISTQPPPPRPYRAATAEEREARRQPEPEEPPKKRWIPSWLNPFADPAPAKASVATAPEPVAEEPRNPERGIEAAQKFVREGVVDKRYKSAARKVLFALLASMVAIGLTPEVYKRVVLGKQQKVIPVRDETEGAMEEEEAGAVRKGP